MNHPGSNGFVYALVEREFSKTGEPIVKVGMSRKNDPAKRLKGYPKGSYYAWVKHTPTPVQDERRILDTLRIWFTSRKDIGAEYFEADQNVLTVMLSAIMQAREAEAKKSPQTEADAEEVVSEPRAMMTPPRRQTSTVDSVSLFDAFASSEAEYLSRMFIPSDELMDRFQAYCAAAAGDNHNDGDARTSPPPHPTLRVGRAWLERQCKSRLGAVIRPRFNGQVVAPMIAFPPLIFSKKNCALIPNPLYPKPIPEANNVFAGFRHLGGGGTPLADGRQSNSKYAKRCMPSPTAS